MISSVTRINRSLLSMLVLAGIAGSILLAAPHSAQGPIKRTPISTHQAAQTYGRIPLSFEANQGQTEGSVDYLARGVGYTLFLKPNEAVFVLTRPQSVKPTQLQPGKSEHDDTLVAPLVRKDAGLAITPAVLRMTLVGADPGATVAAEDELAGKVNYFKGNDPAQWRTEVATFRRVLYHEVYPGIDMIYYGNQRQLEYDFRIAPGSNPQAVRLRFDGADKVEVNATGDLLLTLGESVIRQPKPFIYQEIGGERRDVEGGYAVGADGQVGFNVGAYEHGAPLVIDPTLVYSTYLGGSDSDEGNDIAVDSAGNAYICGITNSANFPTANAIQGTFNPPINPNLVSRDGFITKLNAAGTALVYSTYLGGNADDRCNKIAVDASGNAYVAGETGSSNFPTANAFQSTYGGGFSDGYIAKLNAAGSAFVYSTYLGGDVFDAAHALTIDSTGSVYVTGRTTSSTFPVVNPIQSTYSGGPGTDAFITKINAAGTALVYSTYLGGNAGTGGGFTAGFSIKTDSTGAAYITGQTRATNFPTANAIQATFGGGSPDGDAFVTKLNPAGTALVYSTYLGGSDNDIGNEITVDSGGNAHVTGVVRSTNFPTANAFQSTLKGSSDAFVTKLNSAGTALVYSTYLGGTSDESANGIALDSSGNACVAGGTSSTDFPTVNPTQASGTGTEIFVTKFNAAGSALTYSTYFGSSGSETALAVALDSANSMYLTGRTTSTTYPTLNPVQSTNAGGTFDVFVTKISDPPAGTVQFSAATYSVTEEVTQVAITLTRSGDLSSAATVDYVTSDGTAIQRTDYTIGAGTVRWAAGDGASKSIRLLITEDAYVEGNESFTVTLNTPVGATIGAQGSATVTITDDDTTNPATVQPIDDSNIFVRQHYHDMLAREGDSGGIAYWANEITQCGASATCIRLRRVGVSDAFFFEPEYQDTAAYLYRVYKVSFNTFPSYTPFMRDRSRVVGGVMIEAAKNAFNEAFVQRAAFTALFPLSMTPAQYVDALNMNTGNSLTTFQRDTLVNGLIANTETRGTVLRKVAENSVFIDKEYNNAFVVNLYFGYLRRDPEPGGFNFWLTQINSAPLRDVARQQALVCSFITSQEYQERFSSVVTRTNAECGP
ncbi:MAG: hypothetical protein QOD75_590 [Blastocatellia bacterium]|jgi:hypothetical protein|nr:hypothetical protein [Blastocatellia bacterium]